MHTGKHVPAQRTVLFLHLFILSNQLYRFFVWHPVLLFTPIQHPKSRAHPALEPLNSPLLFNFSFLHSHLFFFIMFPANNTKKKTKPLDCIQSHLHLSYLLTSKNLLWLFLDKSMHLCRFSWIVLPMRWHAPFRGCCHRTLFGGAREGPIWWTTDANKHGWGVSSLEDVVQS